jgi:hypothetical protein
MSRTVRRLLAHIIDALLVGIPISLLFFSFNVLRFIINLLPFIQLPGRTFFAFQANTVLFLMVYEMIALSLFKTTIGKSLMNLRITSVDFGTSRFRIIVRSALKALVSQSALFILLIVSVIMMFRSEGKSSLYDMMMRTEMVDVD